MSCSEASDQETPAYRSPARVLARFFERSRDLWKAKYKALQQRIKAFRTEMRRLTSVAQSVACQGRGPGKEGPGTACQAATAGRAVPPAPSR